MAFSVSIYSNQSCTYVYRRLLTFPSSRKFRQGLIKSNISDLLSHQLILQRGSITVFVIKQYSFVIFSVGVHTSPGGGVSPYQ